MLLLDEATSSVDAWTEDLIRRGLRNITSGRASILVAHRFSTLADADRLLGERLSEPDDIRSKRPSAARAAWRAN